MRPRRPVPPPQDRRPPAATGTHGLARVLSRFGLVSRNEAARWIAAGRVTVDGTVVRDPERRTDPHRERLAVDGQPVRPAKRLYYAMNKPVGVVTTARDPQGRETVYDVLREALKTPGLAPGVGPQRPPEPAPPRPGTGTSSPGPGTPPRNLPWLFPVGRLDAMTLGLLVFTNDTAFGDLIAGGNSTIPKTYEVKVRGVMPETAVARLRQGVTLDDGLRTRPAEVRVLKANEGTTWLEITLREGMNRQVRRMCQAVGHDVVKLRRTRIGPLELGDLPAGAVRPLSRKEVDAFRAPGRSKVLRLKAGLPNEGG